MQKDALRRDLLTPDEVYARHHYLREGVGGSRSKEFFRFYVATSCGRIITKAMVDSIKTITKWFFASFTCITGTSINGKDRDMPNCKDSVSHLAAKVALSVRQALPGDGTSGFPVMFRPCTVPVSPAYKPTI
jgi:hypothetical protein